MNTLNLEFQDLIKKVVGSKNLLSDTKNTVSYRVGIRVGNGSASAVILPGNLLELWKVLNICVSFNKVIIMQAANTGLTGGSTPFGENYDRDVVIINTLKVDNLIVLKGGKQVIAFPGTTLYQLEEKLSPIGRSPHSVIGSSCIGASVVGGICNNSGGNLVNRGPAYTELSLYVRLNENKKIELINHLGIDLGQSPEDIIDNLQNINFDPENIGNSIRYASDEEYKVRVRDITASTPARFNSDKRRLYESSGCAGKIAVFAVLLDTFPKAKRERVFFIGTNNPSNLTNLRKKVLTKCKQLPDMGEYMHRSYFDGSYKYCKDTFAFIKYFGTASIPGLLFLKRNIDRFFSKSLLMPSQASDRVLQCMSSFIPDHLSKRVRNYRDRFEHYLIILASDESISEIEELLSIETDYIEDYEYIKCNESEGKDLLLHRYVAGSAPMRFGLLNEDSVGELLPLDVALPRNCDSWHEIFPQELKSDMAHLFEMGHFFCMVFHWDIIVNKGVDALELKNKILKILDDYGAKYPAEHNVGHIYKADKELQIFYKQLDPTNTFNPGLGKTSKRINYS